MIKKKNVEKIQQLVSVILTQFLICVTSFTPQLIAAIFTNGF